MRRLLLSAVGASMLAIASAANAVVILPGAPLTGGSDPSTVFITSPNPVPSGFVGPITATIGHTGITGVSTGTSFSDTFAFTIGTLGMGFIGTGSGSLTTTVDLQGFGLSTDLDIDSVVINGTILALQTLRDINGVACLVEGVGTCGATETFAASNVPIPGGQLTPIVVTGTSRGNGSYGGNLTFTPAAAVPEPATWAMMLLGFAGIGWQFRRRRNATLAQFA